MVEPRDDILHEVFILNLLYFFYIDFPLLLVHYTLDMGCVKIFNLVQNSGHAFSEVEFFGHWIPS